MFIQGTDGAQMSLHDEDTQGGSNMTGTDLYVKKKPHCAAAVRP